MANLDEQIQILDFPDLGDERGNLVVVEGGIAIPFDIQRIFYIYGSDTEVIRGCHANLRSEFVMINVSGTSKVKVDNGHETHIIELNRPRMGLYLKSNVWKEMYEFSEDSVMMVLSSEGYDAEEYIRNFDEFVHEVHAMRHGKYKNREKRKQTVKWRRKEPCKLSTPS